MIRFPCQYCEQVRWVRTSKVNEALSNGDLGVPCKTCIPPSGRPITTGDGKKRIKCPGCGEERWTPIRLSKNLCRACKKGRKVDRPKKRGRRGRPKKPKRREVPLNRLLLVVGDYGASFYRLNRVCSGCGLENRIEFVGRPPSPEELQAGCDMCRLPLPSCKSGDPMKISASIMDKFSPMRGDTRRRKRREKTPR